MDQIDPQPLTLEILDDQVLDNFKSSLMETFDGKSDPLDHIIIVNTLTTIIGATNLLNERLWLAC